LKKDSQDIKLVFFCFCSFLAAYMFLPARISLPFNDFPNQYSYIAFHHKAQLSAKIVAVAIDDSSLNKIPMQYPWRRSVYADLLRNLDREGVRVIGFDLVFKGASENSQDAQALAQALQGLKASVVLGYDLDLNQWSPSKLSDELPEQSYMPGVLYAQEDVDRVVRRATISYKSRDQVYYSFVVMIASAFSGKSPAEIAASMRTVIDRGLREVYIDYRVKGGHGIPVVSFYDCLYNMDDLKSKWGGDFLKDSIVIVYPESAVSHDIHSTPLGKLPGGFLHINALNNILSNSTVDSPVYVNVILFLLSAAALILALRMNNFQSGLIAYAGILVFNFVAAFLLWNIHIKTDFAKTFAFSSIFFILAGAYKSFEFMSRLNAIKDRATIDPLRGVYTLRYFTYRLELEVRRRPVHCIMAYFEHLKDSTDEMSFERLKQIWGKIQAVLSHSQGCWASYSIDEVVGYSTSDAAHLELVLHRIQIDLEELFKSLDMKVSVRVCAMQCDRDSSFHDLFAGLSRQLLTAVAAVLILPPSHKNEHLLSQPASTSGQQLLDGLAEDIEEKNRQLLNLYEKLKAEHGKTKEAFYQIITSLVNALEARDPYTQGHSQRVAAYSLALADRLGWPQDQKERLRKASLLHDLGKIGIPDSILHKKTQLTEEEFNVIKQHEITGVNILKPLKEIEDILPWILYHHEKWDGTGYPHGLGADAIPIASQMITIADVYDALTTGRDYKSAVAPTDAIAIILKGKGTHFNPELADMFVSIISQPHL
jgi:putative nucleotidyltransferase with HDIG domain